MTLIDLCGHERYLKTTIFGLTGMLPDYGLVVIGANMGISRMTKEVSVFFIPRRRCMIVRMIWDD